ncbi:hypothetical protein NCU16586 [Neurospora crassa OR74A]|uniref:Uncharacterized protein n=1 Tax=Neurospora crassa (strain ATCC 24698 / 74-OR23-1A / CBS 708.71 / DSM 1257 / FGSC 987) TaxID=367110 RepID=V5IR73_NEUCR|nr:hypothetical protein NCU16586 [Neurospora crassa OR74A]ESA43706.1 hypothetical protein NCU16586 [Neurospora crassa OR74A]|eukprot:XP_011393707.1 hypothetical protein NCU16586 [Neurospora crassa OR74A]
MAQGEEQVSVASPVLGTSRVSRPTRRSPTPSDPLCLQTIQPVACYDPVTPILQTYKTMALGMKCTLAPTEFGEQQPLLWTARPQTTWSGKSN